MPSVWVDVLPLVFNWRNFTPYVHSSRHRGAAVLVFTPLSSNPVQTGGFTVSVVISPHWPSFLPAPIPGVGGGDDPMGCDAALWPQGDTDDALCCCLYRGWSAVPDAVIPPRMAYSFFHRWSACPPPLSQAMMIHRSSAMLW